MRKVIPTAIIAVFLSAFVMINVYASQLFDGLMFDVMTLKDQVAAERFLSRLEGTKFHDQQYIYLNNLFGNAIYEESNAREFNTQATINNYIELLNTNPKSRDLLVKIALLQFERGNKDEAAKYYSEAKKIDPWLHLDTLESIK